MSRDPLAAMEDLDGARRDPYPHGLAQQRVWHRVVMPLDFDVIIEADLALLPFRVKVGLDRIGCAERRHEQLTDTHKRRILCGKKGPILCGKGCLTEAAGRGFYRKLAPALRKFVERSRPRRGATLQLLAELCLIRIHPVQTAA